MAYQMWTRKGLAAERAQKAWQEPAKGKVEGEREQVELVDRAKM